MAKKKIENQEEIKEVNEVLNKAIINVETENNAENGDDMILPIEKQQELPQEVKEITSVVDEKKDINNHQETTNKTIINRSFGLIWNGQEFDF